MATSGVISDNTLIKASVTQIAEKLKKKPPDREYGLASLFSVNFTATNIYRNNDITTNLTDRTLTAGTHLHSSREGTSSAAYRTLNDRGSSLESRPLSLAEGHTSPPPSPPPLLETSPQPVGTVHGRPSAHELNDPVPQNVVQTLPPLQRESLQSAGTVHGRPYAHGLGSQARHSAGPVLPPQEGNNPEEVHGTYMGNANVESNVHPYSAPQGNATQLENNNPPIPNPNPNRRTRKRHSRKAVKAAIKVASLNMRGYGNENPNHAQNKWNYVNQIIRDEKIGILLLQETHMDVVRHSQVQKLFVNRLHILYSADPVSPTRRGGVAIVLNKRFVPSQGAGTVRTEEIVGGRALLLTLELNEQRKLRVLAIYAPNDPYENQDFWNRLKEFFEENPNTILPIEISMLPNKYGATPKKQCIFGMCAKF